MSRMRGWCGALLGLVSSTAACAQDRPPALADYNRAVWTASDGAPTHVARIAQTPDGWLWLGTPNGLYRFDGARFYPFVPADGARLLSPRVWELAPQPNGDLYIGYEAPGLSVLRADGRLEHLAPATKDSPVDSTNDVLRDRDGVLWVATSFGLRRFENGSWSALGSAQGCPDPAVTIAFDPGERLWATDGRRLFRSEGQARALHPVVEQELCAIGSEALRNAFRHAQAKQHEVIVAYGAAALVLTVRDDGRGFEAGEGEKPGHWGLRGMEERAGLIHADLRLRTAPGAGTTWRIEIKAALAYADVQPRARRRRPP